MRGPFHCNTCVQNPLRHVMCICGGDLCKTLPTALCNFVELCLCLWVRLWVLLCNSATLGASELCSLVGYCNATAWGIYHNMLSVFCCSDGAWCASLCFWTARGGRGTIPPEVESSGQQAGSKPTWGQDAWEGHFQNAFFLSASVKVISDSVRQHDSALTRSSCTEPACCER